MSILEHHFPPLIAEKYGVNAAIFLRDIYHWCSTNRDNEQNLHEGRWWTYQTIKGLCRRHTYWTKNQVEHIIKTCQEKGALLSGHFSEDPLDRTRWYTLTDEAWELFEGPFSISEISEMQFGKNTPASRKNQKCYKDKYKTENIKQIYAQSTAQACVGYFYYENNDKKLFDRLVALKAKVSFGKIKRYDLQEEDFEQIVAVQNALTAPALEFVDASGMTAADVRAMALSRHYELVVVDYLQKIPGSRGRRGLSDFERVSEVSGDLQNLGRQTGTAVLALSQLTRPEKGKAPEPGMHSFRQSGQIEQDADVALLLYKEAGKDQKTARVLKIGKNKEGEANLAMRMYFDGDTQTFSRVFPAPEKQEKPRWKAQVSFWEGWKELPDDGDNPFPEE